MIIMALDHVRDYFHNDAFYYGPTDLTQTSPFLFFTRFITHYCAPVFVFLAGTSAYLSGRKKSTRELSIFLLKRGSFLVLIELFVMPLLKTFNPTYPYLQLQVIWAIGISMIVLSALIHMRTIYILLLGTILVFGHNLLDKVHMRGDGFLSFLWSVLHEQKMFEVGHFSIFAQYPLLPWIGLMALGYCFGSLYAKSYNEWKRRILIFSVGVSAILLFMILRIDDTYGEPAPWTEQKNMLYSFLSFINVSKYPPSLLYILITVGPALIFLSLAERPLRSLGEKIVIFGRVPMFYYLAHFFLIHFFASIVGIITGYPGMIVLSKSVYRTTELKGFGFDLTTVYLIWIGLIFLLYPVCKWFDNYKRTHQQKHWWLSYL